MAEAPNKDKYAKYKPKPFGKSELSKLMNEIKIQDSIIKNTPIYIDTDKGPLLLEKKRRLLPVLKKKKELIERYKQVFNKEHSNKGTRKNNANHIFNAQKKIDDTIKRFEKEISELQVDVKQYQEKEGLISLNTFLKLQEEEKEYFESLQEKAQVVYEKRGALCDNEGFYSHYGECWSDATQQLLLNQNGIKETMQKVCITEKKINVDSIKDDSFFDTGLLEYYTGRLKGTYEELLALYTKINYVLIQQQKKWVQIYFHELQKRFLRHYLTEGKRRDLLETCDPKQPALEAVKQLQQLSMEARMLGIEAIKTAILGKVGRFVPKSYKNNNSLLLKGFEGFAIPSPSSYIEKHKTFEGGFGHDISIIWKVMNDLFFQNNLKLHTLALEVPETKNQIQNLLQKNICCSCEIEFKSKKNEILNDGHSLALYTCGLRQLFYENNYGIFAFPWKNFLRRYCEIPNAEIQFVKTTLTKQDQRRFTSYYPVLKYSKKVLFKTKISYETYLGETYVTFTEFNFEKKIDDILYTMIERKDTVVYLNSLQVIEIPNNFSDFQNISFPLKPEARLAVKGVLQQLDHAFQTGNVASITKLIDYIIENNIKIPSDYTVQIGKNKLPLITIVARKYLHSTIEKLKQYGFDTAPLLSEFQVGFLKGKEDYLVFLLNFVQVPETFSVILDGKQTPILQAAKEQGYFQFMEALQKRERPNPNLNVFSIGDPGSPRTNGNFAGSPTYSEPNIVAENKPKQYNSRLNTPDEFGWTPLMQAAKARDKTRVEDLLTRGANPNSKGPDPEPWGNGMTPLHAACIPEGREDNSEVVKVLLEAGAGINATTNDGTTPLALASQYSHPNVIKLLCENGADAQLKGTDPWEGTPLTPMCPAQGGKRFKKTRKHIRKRRGRTAKRR